MKKSKIELMSEIFLTPTSLILNKNRIIERRNIIPSLRERFASYLLNKFSIKTK